MRRVVFLAALAALSCAAAATLPDSVTKDKVTYARRGSLGANSYVVTNIVVPCLVGVVSTFWFGICSTRDLLRLFRDLEEREKSGGGLNALDDGRVEGHVSLADAAEVARVESASTKE